MLTDVHAVKDEMIRILKSATPEYLPNIKFVQATSLAKLQEQTFGSAVEATRRFQVWHGPLGGERGATYGVVNDGLLIDLVDYMVVTVRYGLFDDTAWDGFDRMTAYDQHYILWLLNAANSETWQIPSPHKWQPTGGISLTETTGGHRGGILRIPFQFALHVGR